MKDRRTGSARPTRALPAVAVPPRSQRYADAPPDPLTTVIAVLRAHGTFDFGCYRPAMLRRRVQRRMSLRHLDDMAEYVEVLRRDPPEVTALCKDMLITVTGFFREPAAWRTLQERVIRPLVAAKRGEAPVRAWVPGCATGEEAYSLAMLLIEEIQASRKRCRIQVFASDVDPDALQVARTGVYSERAIAGVPPDRRARFFTPGEAGYRVTTELREAVIVARHSLTRDPPFSKLDLLSCRNLLIYLEPAAQRRIVTLFHFALTAGGYLLLGDSEGIGSGNELFKIVSRKWRIYRRVDAPRRGSRRSTTLPGASAAGAPAISGSQQLRRLESELEATREDLQRSIEDLRGANEELTSLNEELQSSNEELETSKEELQSLNEELSTANSQLEAKVDELEAARNDLDNLLASTNIATLFLDTDFRIRRYTPAATRLFSLIPSDIGRPLGDITQKFADPDLLADAAAVRRTPVARTREVRADDGRWYVRQALPYRTRRGRTDGVVLTLSDVAAEALQEARIYAEAIVDTVREPLLVLDSDLRILSANQSFYTTFHVSEEATAGRSLYELGNRQWDIPRLRTLLSDVLPRKRELTDFEVRHDFAAIGPRVMLLNARALRRGGGRPDLILLALLDVTDRRRAQEALRESEAREHLEEQLRQRQAELAHALRVTTLGELASGLAHELNQPLTAIANGVEACARYVRAGTVDPAKLLTLLDDASSEALRAGDIVEHLRGFIEKGKPRFRRTDLGDIARHVRRLLEHELTREGVTLQLDLAPQPVPIHADRIQIEQVLVNLLQNAIEVERENRGAGKRIDLAVCTREEMAEAAVRDTGTGVAAAAADRLFEPFFTTKPQGLGMGLAISRSIIEAHRGRIWVERPVDGGPGTTVRFSLPLSTAPALRRRRSA